MLHCPYCGTQIKENESYCINCGRKIPSDIQERRKQKRQSFHKLWLLPPLLLGLMFFLTIGFYFLLEKNKSDALEHYHQGEQQLVEGNYEDAQKSFAQSLNQYKHFKQAATALGFTKEAIEITNKLNDAKVLLQEQDFQKALTLTTNLEKKLQPYSGDAVNVLINSINETHNTIKIQQLSAKLDQNPTIDELKILLWEAEDIGKKAESISNSIRDQIIDYSFSKASELLNKKQFNDALLYVEDGIKYAPNAEKLLSLKTTIDKEKTAFETAQQQRIEQAMTLAEAENQLNKEDAVELVSVTTEKDDQNNMIVKGEVKSRATIPIHSILIDYSIIMNGNEIVQNEVFAYPDTIYPGESGHFEFTHYELQQNSNAVDVEVNKITWYTNETE